MTEHRWTRLQELYEAALARPADEQSAFLRHACGDDPQLYDEVLSLLEVEVHSLFAGYAVDAVPLPEALTAEGERVGPYRVGRELGRGGMGTVYLAERADGAFERTVALKLVKRGMDTDAVLDRFRAERQILARLQHPHVARLLEGGAGADGRPYFAMEYVNGEPITDYCDARALPVEARLRLFEDVCAAVAYAHQNLVVHRDLKPSNILVTREGVAKLLDFGIAKVLAGDDEAALTRTGRPVLTPAYAAPEQLREEAVTTATDVYGLGVVLYELLAGRRPFPDDRHETGRLDALPVRPSAAVERTRQVGRGAARRTVAPEGVARARRTTPDRLRRALRGDLDTIVLKALHPEPARRYPSAEGLLADLRAFRADRPIAARPDARSYRLRKYLRRHRTGVAAAALVLILVGALVGFYTARLTAERDRARLEADKATQMAAFLGGLFQSADPSETQGDSALVRDVLDRGAARLEAELADQPAVQAALMQVIGEVYTTLERYDQADSLLSAALARTRALYPEGHADVADAAARLARLRDYTGDYAAAETLYGEALALRRRLLGPDHATLADALYGLASVRYRQGRYAEADSLFAATLTLQLRHHAADAPELAPTYDFLGVLADERGDLRAADSLARRALAIRRAHLTPPHADLAESLLGAGLARRNLGRYDEAEAHYLEALAMRRALYGDQHTDVAHSLNHLASLHFDQGRHDLAERYAREGLAIRAAVHGERHVETIASLGNLARVQRARGDLDGAQETLRRALPSLRAAVGPAHPYVGAFEHRLGALAEAQGRAAEAERAYREALGIYRGTWPEGHARVGDAALALGALLAERRPDEAVPLLRESLRLRRAAHGRTDARTALALGHLGRALAHAGRPDEAARALTDALALLRTAPDADPVEVARLETALAAVDP